MNLTDSEKGLIRLRSKLDQIYSIEPKNLKLDLEVKILDLIKQISYSAIILYTPSNLQSNLIPNNFYYIQLLKFYSVKNPINYVNKSTEIDGIIVGITNQQLLSTSFSGLKLSIPTHDTRFIQVLYLHMADYFKEWLVFNKNWKL